VEGYQKEQLHQSWSPDYIQNKIIRCCSLIQTRFARNMFHTYTTDWQL